MKNIEIYSSIAIISLRFIYRFFGIKTAVLHYICFQLFYFNFKWVNYAHWLNNLYMENSHEMVENEYWYHIIICNWPPIVFIYPVIISYLCCLPPFSVLVSFIVKSFFIHFSRHEMIIIISFNLFQYERYNSIKLNRKIFSPWRTVQCVSLIRNLIMWIILT